MAGGGGGLSGKGSSSRNAGNQAFKGFNSSSGFGGTNTSTGETGTQTSATTSASTTSASSLFGKILGALGVKEAGGISPVASTYAADLNAILSGNPFNAMGMPAIQNATAAEREAGSAGQAEATKILGQTGAGRSSFAGNVLATGAQSEAQALGLIPGQVEESFISGAPGFISGQEAASNQALGTAAATNAASTTTGTTNALTNFIQQLVSASSWTANQWGTNQGVGASTSAGSAENSPLLLLSGLLASWLGGGRQ